MSYYERNSAAKRVFGGPHSRQRIRGFSNKMRFINLRFTYLFTYFTLRITSAYGMPVGCDFV